MERFRFEFILFLSVCFEVGIVPVKTDGNNCIWSSHEGSVKKYFLKSINIFSKY